MIRKWYPVLEPISNRIHYFIDYQVKKTLDPFTSLNLDIPLHIQCKFSCLQPSFLLYLTSQYLPFSLLQNSICSLQNPCWTWLLQLALHEYRHHSNKPPAGYQELQIPSHHTCRQKLHFHWLKIPSQIEYKVISLTLQHTPILPTISALLRGINYLCTSPLQL